MTELERITINISREIPEGENTIVRVSDIENPEEALENCKKVVNALLANPSLGPEIMVMMTTCNL